MSLSEYLAEDRISDVFREVSRYRFVEGPILEGKVSSISENEVQTRKQPPRALDGEGFTIDPDNVATEAGEKISDRSRRAAEVEDLLARLWLNQVLDRREA